VVGSLTYASAHGGSYSIYYALAVASNEIKIDHRYDVSPVLQVVSGNSWRGKYSPKTRAEPVQTRFYKYGASCKYWALSTMGGQEKDCLDGSSWTFGAVAFQGHNGEGKW